MNTDRIRTIIDKEWAEVFKNKMVFFTVLFMPLIFTLLPIVTLSAMGGIGNASGGNTDVPQQFALACGNISGKDCITVYMVNQFMLLYMMMPVIIPITIASYSIVGEKTTRSLEPLLATPITTVELIAGKGLAAAIPAIVATWGCFIIFLISLPLIGISPTVQAYIGGPIWLLGIFVGGPLMTILAVIFALIVSSRVNDPRVAEQFSAILIMPILLLLLVKSPGWSF
jgi:ABC-2 type transport system permease protein